MAKLRSEGIVEAWCASLDGLLHKDLAAVNGRWSTLNSAWTYVVPIGFVGAYTTFSTYEWELFKLGEQGAWGVAGLYLIASNVVGFGAVVLGSALGKRL